MAKASTKGIATSGYAKFAALSEAEKERVWESFNREVPMSELRPLTSKERQQHGMPPRPTKRGAGREALSVTVDRALLRRADAFAKANGLTRAEVVSRGIAAVVDVPARNGSASAKMARAKARRRKAS